MTGSYENTGLDLITQIAQSLRLYSSITGKTGLAGIQVLQQQEFLSNLALKF